MTNDNRIIPHVFISVTIFQASEDTIVAGRFIPKGYCNLTHILKAASAETGKRKAWSSYIKSESTQDFLQALAGQNNQPIIEESEVPYDASAQPCGLQPLIIVIKGGNPSEQGTWGHLEVAIHLACWASPKLAVWAIKSLRAVIEGDFQALTEEAAIAQAKLQEQWQKIRDASKEAFWTLGDAIAEYKKAHPEHSDKFRQFVYSNCQDAVNRGLFGKSASQIRIELEAKDLLRDHYGVKALKRLDIIQAASAAIITNQDTDPLEAVKQVLAMFNFEVISYAE